MRTGIGIDTHRFEDGRRLVLGGVEIPGARGLAGHSDADVLTHAIVDALLGAAGLGDIGELFPDTDELWRDADSMALLRDVLGAWRRRAGRSRTSTRRWCSSARSWPRTATRSASRSSVLGSVNVKFTTGEKMGFVGREEGAAALAVATLAPVVSP